MYRLGRTPRTKNKGGDKSGRGRLRQIKHDRGIKGRDDKSRGIEILMVETFAKINPTEITIC